jgi:excisionase family DNA binding protein
MQKNPKMNAVSMNLLTTGDIARHCETSVKQVNRWIIGGKLEAFRNPGGHYRITKDKFREFLDRNNMPIIAEFFVKPQKKILIADDDAPLAKAYAYALKKRFKDVKIDTAIDGYETLIKTGKFNPDILILDIRMPKIDGLEVCRRLRNDSTSGQEIKILVVSAYPHEYDRQTVIANGANDYLIKPIPIHTLIEQVEKML